MTFAPSEATAGAPWQSRDGWTVQIEKVAMRASAVGRPQEIGDRGYYGSGGEARLVDPRYDCEVRVTSLSPGPVAVSVQMQSFDPRWGGDQFSDDVCAVDELTVRRFKGFSDDTLVTPELFDPNPSGGYTAGYTPTLYVKGTAVKDAKVLRFDWALAVQTSLGADGEYDENGEWHPKVANADSVVNVEANKGAPAKFEVHIESLFARGLDELAAADTNADGTVTPDELRAVNLACESYTSSSSSGSDTSSSGYTSSGYTSSGSVTLGDDDDSTYDPSSPSTDSTSTGRCITLLRQLVVQGTTVIGKVPMKR